MEENNTYYLQLADKDGDQGRISLSSQDTNVPSEGKVLFNPFIQVVEFETSHQIERSPTKKLQDSFEQVLNTFSEATNVYTRKKEALVRTSNLYCDQLNKADAQKCIGKMQKELAARQLQKQREIASLAKQRAYARNNLGKDIRNEFYKRQNLSPVVPDKRRGKRLKMPVPCFRDTEETETSSVGSKAPQFRSQSLDYCLQRNKSLPALKPSQSAACLLLKRIRSHANPTTKPKVAISLLSVPQIIRSQSNRRSINLSSDIDLDMEPVKKAFRSNRQSNIVRVRNRLKKQLLNAYADSGYKVYCW